MSDFPNPYHGTEQFGGRADWSHTWFHGTKGTLEFGERRGHGDMDRLRVPPEQREMHSSWPQPNQMLGVHFSPLHEVAHKFVGSVSSSPGALVHARLNFSNPAHFPRERDLDLGVARWASKNYPAWHNDRMNGNLAWNYSDQEGTHRDWHATGDEDRLGRIAQHVLQGHPHLPEILHGFTQHLRDQGHRGITYGNGVEGPYDTDMTRGGQVSVKAIEKRKNWPRSAPYSISAIARPEDIETTHVEHIAPWREQPKPHERTWEEASDQDEPDAMRDKILAYHREHGGAMPGLRKQAVAQESFDWSGLTNGRYDVPTEAVHALRQHDRVNSGKYTHLADEIAERGIEKPLEVSLHDDGRVVLRGGSHRVNNARNLGHLTVPVQVVDMRISRTASSGERWYHGTHCRFSRGDMIAPGHLANDDLGMMEPGGSRPYVYAASTPEMADFFAGEAARAHPGSSPVVYEVHPTGPMEIDPELHESDLEPEAYRSAHPLRVLRKHRPARTAVVASSGERYVTCGQGHSHWGAHGAAGMLIRHRDPEDNRYRYLLQKRSPWVDHGSTWGLPGGALHQGEEPHEGALRESREELGPLPRDLKHHHTVTDDHGRWKYHTCVYDSPDRFIPKGGGATDDETDGTGWFTVHEIRDLPLHPGFAKTWDKVRRSRTDKTAAVGYRERVEHIHPRDLLPYAQREAWRTQDPGGRRHISDLAEDIRQHGYDPERHGGMSGDTHSWPPSFPITLVHDDDDSWLWNGYHRTFALNESGYDKPVPVLVKDFRNQKTAAAGHETWYHITDNPKFSLNPHHEPHDNAFAIQDRSGRKGVYMARDPEVWMAKGYVRPYVAEIHAPKGIENVPGNVGRWGGETFVPAEHFHQLTVHRVIPVDAYEREEYGEHGRMETHHGTEFDTGKPIDPGNHHPFGWNERTYRYPGPDAREMTPEQHQHHRERALQFLRHTGYDSMRQDDEGVEHLRQTWARRLRTDKAAVRTWDRPGGIYLRFGRVPKGERSRNNVTGFPEDGVSVYDLDHKGEPEDPDPYFERGHQHEEGCGPHCDLDQDNDEYGNDTGDEMHGRVRRAEQNRARGSDHPDETAHLVTGDVVALGHDAEPLLRNVRRVGDWIDHRHLLIPGAPRHPLARDEHDEDYEPPSRPGRLAGAKGELPLNLRFHHQPPDVTGHWEPHPEPRWEGDMHWVDEDPATGHHILSVSTGNNRTLGWMHWDKGVVRSIDVSEGWQRRGLATAMWERARQITPGLRHSDNRTENGQDWARSLGEPLPERVQDHPEWFTHEAALEPQLKVRDYEGRTGDPTHITRNENGLIPAPAIAHLHGVNGEQPGHSPWHRTGQDWDDFKADIAANGIRDPVFITVDYGQEPKISEGNQRRDAAVELGHSHIPVEIRYFGNAQHQGSVWERAQRMHPEAMDKTAATDWDQFHDKIPGEIHRGLYAPESHGVFSVPMSDEDIAHGLIAAHQEEHFPYERDRHRLFGTHWTSDEGVAREFAREHEREHFADDPDHDHDEHFGATPVVFHAQRPQRHEIEDDPRRLGWQNVDDYDTHEKEVPIRHGAPVRLTGVSWLKHTGLGPMWHRHDFREPVELRAEDRDSPGDPNQWNASLHMAAKEKPTKTKEQVNYRKGTRTEHCGNCTMIRLNAPDFESHSCTLVKGLIEEEMTCDEWYPERKKEAVLDPGIIFSHREWKPGKHSFEAHDASGENVGYSVAIDKGDHGYIDEVYVRPGPHRGSGLARKLTQMAVDHFAGRPTRLMPDAYQKSDETPGLDDDALRGFYQSMGFEQDPSQRRHMIRHPDKTARIKRVKSDEPQQGIMVAIVPPASVLDHLQSVMKPLDHKAEPRNEMHVTVLYLGKTGDRTQAELDKLPELVRQWAKTVAPFAASVQGGGTFRNDGEHPLVALVDVPGEAKTLHSSLAAFIEGHGIDVKHEHVWIPHITLAYSKHPVRFLPDIRKMPWRVKEIWYVQGSRWESVPLAGRG